LAFQFKRTTSERTFLYQVVGNATFSVDTFFFISGLLVVLLFLKEDKKKQQKTQSTQHNSWANSLRRTFVMIFYRFLRLTPVYVVVIVFTEVTVK
jgi:peptidoglycan/LPS O-acetylase OafA/YrhL